MKKILRDEKTHPTSLLPIRQTVVFVVVVVVAVDVVVHVVRRYEGG